MKVLAVIPARSGSKGVIKKNIRELAGKPLVCYTIEAAQKSKKVNDIILSTDSDEIAKIGKSCGIDVPWLRPSELAQDETPASEVAGHVFKKCDGANKTYDAVVWLQPTSPFRKSADIDSCITKLFNENADSVVSVYKVEDNHPSRMYKIESGKLVKIWPENKNNLRQQNDPIYHRNGAVYAFKTETFMRFSNFVGEHMVPYIMTKENSLNIDDEMDFMIADHFMRGIKENNESVVRLFQ